MQEVARIEKSRCQGAGLESYPETGWQSCRGYIYMLRGERSKQSSINYINIPY
jgi:hypothetical protein